MMQHEAAGTAWRGPTEWALGILGAIAGFLGLFILFAEEEQSIGIGGELSWRVGDIAPAWGYGLLIGGGVLVLAAVGLLVFGPRAAPGLEVREHATRDLVWHATAFTLVNAFLWLQDYAVGGGIEYAYWVTIPWGIGLAIHVLAYILGAGGRRSPGGLAR